MTTLDPGFVDACEHESLHRIGAIQPYGALLGGRLAESEVRCVSADLEQWLGLPAAQALGQPLDKLLKAAGAELTNEQTVQLEVALNTAPTASGGQAQKLLLADVITGPRGHLDAILSRTSQDWLMELEPALPGEQRQEALRPVPHALYRMPHTQKDWHAYCQLLAEQTRHTSGFDRVMVYRFLPDGCGEVIAESAAEDMSPYLGLRYPASDIPRIARHLYMINRHRQIPDINAEPVPVLAASGFEPDLTLSDLRAVSPVHLEYLRNMKVTASLSFSVVLNDDLWGLIACHHHSPRAVPLQLRERCADLVQAFGLGVSGYQTHLRLGAVSDSDRLIARLAAGIDAFESGADQSFQIGDALLDLARADGAVLADTEHRRPLRVGHTPEPEELAELLDWLDNEHPEALFATDALASLFPPAKAYQQVASGLLAVRVGAFRGAERLERRFIWLRPEQPRTVYWAGDPRKSSLFDAQSNTLSPRSSFNAWLETKTGHAEPWSDTVMLSAKKFRSLLLRQMNDELLRD